MYSTLWWMLCKWMREKVIYLLRFTYNDFKLRCSAVLQDYLLVSSVLPLCVNLGHDIDRCLKDLAFASSGRLNGQQKARQRDMLAAPAKWEVKQSCRTKTSNTRTDKRNRCRYTGKYQTLTAFRSRVRPRPPECRLQLEGACCLCCIRLSVAAVLLLSPSVQSLMCAFDNNGRF